MGIVRFTWSSVLFSDLSPLFRYIVRFTWSAFDLSPLLGLSPLFSSLFRYIVRFTWSAFDLSPLFLFSPLFRYLVLSAYDGSPQYQSSVLFLGSYSSPFMMAVLF